MKNENENKIEYIGTLDIEPLDSINSEVEGFYRMKTELANKLNYTTKLVPLIKKCAENKIKFYEYYGKNISEEQGIITSFFTKMLIYSEINTGKDLMDYSAEEVTEAIITIGKEDDYSSKTTYSIYLTLIHHYFRWGYQHTPKLKSFVLSSKDLPEYKDVMNVKKFEEKVLKRNEIDKLIQNVNNERVAITLELARAGLKLEEIATLKIEDVVNAEDYKVKLSNRTVKLSPSLFEKVLSMAKATELSAYVKGALIARKLNNTPYVIRMFERVDGNVAPVKKSVLSNTISKSLGEAGYDGTFTDIRTNSMINDYYFLSKDITIQNKDVYILINNKYGVHLDSNAHFLISYKMNLRALSERYKTQL